MESELSTPITAKSKVSFLAVAAFLLSIPGILLIPCLIITYFDLTSFLFKETPPIWTLSEALSIPDKQFTILYVYLLQIHLFSGPASLVLGMISLKRIKNNICLRGRLLAITSIIVFIITVLLPAIGTAILFLYNHYHS